MFAVIWRTLRNKEVLTLDDYVTELQKVFTKETMATVVVKTPMLVPNYDAWIKDAIDKNLARLHHNLQTQHCWRFEAVENSDAFPTGIEY